MIDIDRIIGEGEPIVYSEEIRSQLDLIDTQRAERLYNFFPWDRRNTKSDKKPSLVLGSYVHYFYILIDPITKEVCYVGKTNNPPSRYKQHTTNTGNYSGNIRKSIWIGSLIKLNKLPIMYVLECIDFINPGERKREKQYIQEFWDNGSPLLNQHSKWMQGWKTREVLRERLNNCRWVVGRRDYLKTFNGGIVW